MTEIIGIRFKKVGKIYYFDPNGVQAEKGQFAIVETARGIECGEIVIPNKQVDDDKIVKPLKSLIRIATAEDMANWVKMHLGNGTFNGKEVISRKNHKMLYYPQTITGSDSTRLTNYAQGWTVEFGEQGRYIRHTGLAYGYTALVGLVPDLNLGFVFLTNNGSTSDPQSGLGRDLIELYRGTNNTKYFDEYFAEYKEDLFAKDEEKPAKEETPVAALANKAYTGTYYLDVFGTATIYEKEGDLYFKLKDVDAKLNHKNGNVFKFFQPGSGTYDLIFTVKGNRAQSFTFDINDPVGDFVRK